MPTRHHALRITLAFAVLLAGCSWSQYQSEFECGIPKSAGGCHSLQQNYNENASPKQLPLPPDPTRLSPVQLTDDWTPPVKTIWVAPYVDKAGRRHEASVIRLVIFPGAKVVDAEPEFLIPPIPEVADQGEFLAPPAPPPQTSYGRPSTAPRTAPRQTGAETIPKELIPQGMTPPSALPSGFGLPGQ